MSVAIILKVFKDSSIITLQGEYEISRIFPGRQSAKKAQYRFCAVDNGIAIYRRRAKTGRTTYACIGD
jgi:hypothetical protein